MITLGLTGGIGTGKSTVAKYLVENYDMVHVDADVIAKRVFDEYLETILSFDISHAWSADGVVDRKALFLAMLDDESLKEKVEGIIHPAVHVAIVDAILTHKESGDDRSILLDVPLLFECGLEIECTKVVCVTCPEEDQYKRVMARSGYDKELIKKIIRSQISTRTREAMSEAVIRNNQSIQGLYLTIDLMMESITPLRKKT